MKKILALLLGGLLVNSVAHADILTALEPVTVSGSIQNVSTKGKVTSKPATIANILKTLKITGQNPKKLKFYYDTTTNAVVIAPKIISNHEGTPVATVFTFGANPLSWDTSATSSYAGGDCTVLNSTLTGTYTETSGSSQKNGKTVFTDVISFITWVSNGTGNPDHIFKGTIRGITRPPA